jgi:molybdopterin synthase sulfur carrier subunit
MRVRFSIPGPLRLLTGGQSQVDVDTPGSTLGDALDALFVAYPGIQDRVLTEQREIRQHVNIFIGNSEARTLGGLATSLTVGMEDSILPAISGG